MGYLVIPEYDLIVSISLSNHVAQAGKYALVYGAIRVHAIQCRYEQQSLSPGFQITAETSHAYTCDEINEYAAIYSSGWG